MGANATIGPGMAPPAWLNNSWPDSATDDIIGSHWSCNNGNIAAATDEPCNRLSKDEIERELIIKYYTSVGKIPEPEKKFGREHCPNSAEGVVKKITCTVS